MNSDNAAVDVSCSARVPADVEAPDRILWGLTARQVAIFAAAAAAGYLLWQVLGGRVPLPVLAVVLVPVVGAAAALALGRRDGLPLDAWLLSAARYRRAPRRMVPAPEGITDPPAWGPDVDTRPLPAVLRLPAASVDDQGSIDVPGSGSVALVAGTTVNVGLRTAAEQAAIVGAYGRWLNSLTGPVQIVVSTQRADLSSHAARIADAATDLPHPALADAALDHARFLDDLAEHRDPLWRTVTVACTAPGGARGEASRRAEHAAAALGTVGCRARVLDAATVTAVLTAAVDPYQPTDASWPRTPPHTPVSTPIAASTLEDWS